MDGLTVLMAGDDADGHQVYTVSEGRARVNGYGVDMPTSRRLTYAAVPDLRRIDTEVHTADDASTQSGGQRITVAHPPLHDVEAVRITTRKTVSVVHGSYSGAADTRRIPPSFPSSSAVRVIPSTRRARTTKRTATPWTGPPRATSPPPGRPIPAPTSA